MLTQNRAMTTIYSVRKQNTIFYALNQKTRERHEIQGFWRSVHTKIILNNNHIKPQYNGENDHEKHYQERRQGDAVR